MKNYYVYILTNKKHDPLYIGITSNLVIRIYEHKNNLLSGFTKRYSLQRLVYFEETPNFLMAITRENQLRKWNRDGKINLIEEFNPSWDDLYIGLTS